MSHKPAKLIKPIIVLCILFMTCTGKSYEPLKFSKASWATATSEVRGYMIDDLLANYDLEGMSLKQVNELLGKPDEECSGTTIKIAYFYKLGYKGENPNNGHPSYVLNIKFNENEIAYRVGVWQSVPIKTLH